MEWNKQEMLRYLSILEERKKWYWIMQTKLLKHQYQVIPIIKENITTKWSAWRSKVRPKYKYILFQWWNGSWKTFTGMYITVNLALWDYSTKYWLEYIWAKRDIRIVTKSWTNVEWTILPYLIWNYSKCRIPPDMIEKHDKEKNIIYLVNGCKISIKTYDQWRERLQWWNPDWILIDEEPVKKDIWEEILARARDDKAQILLAMTPLSWLTPVYEYFYEQTSEDVKNKSYKFLVSSLDNTYADNTALLWLDEQQQKMRIYGLFVPPSWLVYPSFRRDIHTLPYFNPEEMWYETKYYWAMDFWVVHPTAFLLIAVDVDANIYIFDMIYKSWMLIKDLAREIKTKTAPYDLEYIVADTAAKRERTELANLWVKTVWADKWSKWENAISNRKAWIMKVNQLLADNKIYIADHLKELINEFEQHHYKEWAVDWEVDKTKDDALDALRYFIFWFKPPKYKSKMEERYERKYGVSYKNYEDIEILNNNNPY